MGLKPKLEPGVDPVLKMGNSGRLWCAAMLILAGAAMLVPAAAGQEALPEIVTDAAALAEGKRTYSIHCSRCHGLTGMGARSTGGGGPSLVDAEWVHGNSFGEMVATLWNGVPGTLMKSWRRTLGADRIQEVAAYVYSFRLDSPR